MCGRFVITSAPEALRQAFGHVEQPNFPARYNIAPTQPIPVVVADGDARHFRLMRWGLVPPWVRDPRKFTLLINARSETVGDKPAFRNALKRRRCIVPADGYFEWQPGSMPKQPYFIYHHERRPFGFAALAETWSGPNGEEFDSVAIITAAAQGEITALHDRVPVAIEPQDITRWMDCANIETDEALTMLAAPPPGAFVWHPVSTRVNKVANDDEQLLLPVSLDETPSAPPARTVRKAAVRPAKDGAQGNLF